MVIRISNSHRPGNQQGPLLLGPAGFDPRDFLPTHLLKFADNARWLMHSVAIKAAYGLTDDEGYARLSSKILQRILHKPYTEFPKSLVESHWLDPIDSYSVGRWSKGYRIVEEHLDDSCRWVEAKDKWLIGRMAAEHDRVVREQLTLWQPIHYALDSIHRGLTISPDADQILEGLADRSRLLQSALVENIRRGIYRSSLGATGRWFNPITGLKRNLRSTLFLDGSHMGGVDLVSAQPALLTVLMRLSAGTKVPTYLHNLLSRFLPRSSDDALVDPSRSIRLGLTGLVRAFDGSGASFGPDFLSFEELVLSGRLYEHLVDRCAAFGIPLPGADGYVAPRRRAGREPPKTPREAVKMWFLRDVLGKNSSRFDYDSGFERIIREDFPSVHRFVRWINTGDAATRYDNYKTLICTLQRLESLLVIENVCPRLVGKIPVIPLHDAVFGRVEDMGIIRDAFQETFYDLGLRMQIKDETVPVGPPLVTAYEAPDLVSV